MNLIENIIKIMEIKGITAYRLEQDTEIKQTTFQGWKRGSQPSADKIIILLSYFEVTPNELFGYDTFNQLNENDKEMLNLFKQLTEREQLKYIARLEDEIDKNNKIEKEGKLSDSKIG